MLALLIPTSAGASTTDPHAIPGLLLDRWTIDDGLPLSHLVDVTQTPDGFLWLATFDGLVRFDGLDFHVLRRSQYPGLPSNRIVRLWVDGQGVLWMQGEEGELGRYIDGELTSYLAGEGLTGRLTGLLMHGQDVYFLTDQGVMKWNGEAPASWHPELVDQPIRFMRFIAPDHALLVTSDAEIIEVSPNGSRRVPAFRAGQTIPHLFDMVSDNAGKLWLGTDVGLFRYDGEHFVRHSEQSAEICRMSRDSTGSLVFAFFDGSWHNERGTVTPPAARTNPCPPAPVAATRGQWYPSYDTVYLDGQAIVELDFRIMQLFVDRADDLWIASQGGGLFRIRAPTVQTVGQADGLPEANLVSVLADPDGSMWLGAANVGLYHWNRQLLSVTPLVPGVSNEQTVHRGVRGMHLDRRGRLWMGNLGMLCRFEADRCHEVEMGDAQPYNVRAVFAASDGALWAGALEALYRGVPDDGGFRWHAYPVAGDSIPAPVSSIVETGTQALLFGTLGAGVFTWRAPGFAPLGKSELLARSRVRHLHEDESGAIWIGTEDVGLCRIDARRAENDDPSTAPVRCLGKSEGLFDEGIHSVVEDEAGRLWMSTNRGIFWVRKADAEAVARGERRSVGSIVIDERDGMLDREANGGFQPAVARDREGRLWYPTQKGAVIVDPASFAFPRPPPIIPLELRVSGQKVALTEADQVLELSSNQREVMIAWTSPEFIRPEQIRYRYRFLPVDQDWRGPTAERRAVLNNLPPGAIRFELQAALGGDFGEDTVILRFHRVPTFRESGWYQLTLALAAVLVVLLAAGLRLRSLRRTRRKLERVVAERTAELAERNARVLAQAARLEELSTLKNRFVANLSHELRTPISLILGPLEDLGAAIPEEPRAQHWMRVVRRNAGRLAELVEQLFDVARLQAGALPLRMKRHLLPVVLRRIAERFESEAARAGRDFALSLDEELPALYFDADLVDKIVSNLLANAFKFTEQGQHIELFARGPDDCDDGAGFVVVGVRDDGIGIAPEHQERLFERFYQVDGADDRKAQGAGIGLALAHELVDLHGGELTVESRPGEGATFVFTLPLGVDHIAPGDIDTEAHGHERPHADDVTVTGERSPDASSAADVDAPTQPVTTPASDTNSATDRALVLVVEDHPDMRAYLCAHLQTRHRLCVASNGHEALGVARAKRPDVIVSDIMMPGMDGLEMARALRADAALASTPVLLVSAKASQTDRITGLRYADDYLTKPFYMPELLARVQHLLERRSSTSVQPAPSGNTTDEAAAAVEDPEAQSGAARQLLERLERVIGDNLHDSGFGVEALARGVALSRRHLHRRLVEWTGKSAAGFLRERRLEHARVLLLRGEKTVSEVAAAVGLSRSYFTRLYRARYGEPPSATRSESSGESREQLA